ncbi:hypothetical protein EI77_02720 [Prosthecobacter fusiformis]|uniref:Uncharacterized protein n=1 Tax=Prosthecobacter fusiformis TaxID=48464 RepID=A0A4R7RXX1_9BACT|nr:hypothetical protein [Prosthecobacter fusiformis]TDU70672.1 hypothetical protein EI77_02720 [Prosthecobacter fusiformis]
MMDPSKLESMITVSDFKKVSRYGLWLPHGWTDKAKPVGQELALHPSLRAIFHDKISYKDTDQYRKMHHAVEQYLHGKVKRPSLAGAYWCRSYEDIDRYFEILMGCYEDIRLNGYKSQTELRQIDPTIVRSNLDEIKIAVDSQGKAIFIGKGGNHRFSIVRNLKIPVIPVILVGVDKGWARKNVTLKGYGSDAAYESVRLVVEELLRP